MLWDILRCWVADHPVKAQAERTPGSVILAKEPEVRRCIVRVIPIEPMLKEMP